MTPKPDHKPAEHAPAEHKPEPPKAKAKEPAVPDERTPSHEGGGPWPADLLLKRGVMDR